jgi:rRNA maturation RNase YbeY
MPRQKTIQAVQTVIAGERHQIETINVIFLTNQAIKQLNARFLRHNYATDVLTFRLNEGRSVDGELYISLDMARRQAKECGVGFMNEVLRLVIHGTLHLIGYGDDKPKESRLMKRKEEQYLRIADCGFSIAD